MKNLLFFFCFSFSFLNAQIFVDGEWELLSTPQSGVLANLQVKSNGVIYATNFRSFDDGLTWEKHDIDPFYIGYDGVIIEYEGYDNNGIRGTLIKYSIDDGATYEEKIAEGYGFDFIKSLSNGKWMATTFGISGTALVFNVYISENEGDDWNRVYSGRERHGRPFEIADDLIFIPSDFISGSYDGTICNLNTNTSFGSSIPVYNQSFQVYHKFSIAPNGTIWLAAHSGIARSKDYGESWEEIKIDTTGDRVSSILTLANGDLIVEYFYDERSYTVGRKYFKSTDNGMRWQQLPEDLSLPQLHYQLSPQGTAFGLKGGFFRSIDNATQWEPSSKGLDPIGLSDMKWVGNDSIIALSAGWMAKSIDRGQTWEIIEEDKLSDWLDVGKISNVRNGRVLVRTKENIYFTDDFGESFKKLAQVDTSYFFDDHIFLYDFKISPQNEFLLSTSEGLLISKDQ